MSVEFRYIEHPDIAPLAWGMVVKIGQPVIDVHVGSMVETTPDFFVSGVWDGAFADGGFDKAELFCGGGVKRHGDAVTAYTSTHERQRLCYAKKEDAVYVSNSVPFVLALTGDTLDIQCDQYEAIFCSIVDGLEEYQKEVPLANGASMYQIFSSDITIDGDGCVTVTRKPLHRDFENFDDYYQSIVNVTRAIRENGEDAARKYPLEMMTTTSSGYDSSACAAIAYAAGCRLACTLKDGKYDEDSGVGVAKQLGYDTVVEAGCYDYRERPDDLDATFFADGDLGFFMPFDGFRDAFKQKIVVTGISGGYMWDTDSKVNPDSKRTGYPFYLTNISFCEHSLRYGYVMLPLVLYASTAAESVVAISNTAEMEPWTMHTNYDRPIPRRILETAGVKRGTFATANRGGGVSFSRNFRKAQIQKKMTYAGYESFVRWLSEKGRNRWTPKRVWHAVRYHRSTIPEYMDFVLLKLGKAPRFGGKRENHVPNPGLPAKMVIWGIETEIKRYKAML